MSDLDWLARNVHEWPTLTSKDPKIHRVWDKDEVISIARLSHENDEHYSYDQWLTHRAELQGKPSWDDAPDDAKALVYCPNSKSWKFEKSGNLYPVDIGWTRAYWTGVGSAGEVLGDWRKTLERRPEKEPASTEWTGPEDGLPSAGTRCLVNGSIHHNKLEVEILYMDENRGVYLAEYVNNAECKVNYISQSSFYRLPTEEDEVVEDMLRIYHENDSVSVRDAFRDIYRAGYRKVGDSNENT